MKNFKTNKKLALLLPLVSILLLLITSCGSQSTTAKSSTPSKLSGSITIGFLNQQEGAVAFPDFGAGAQAARIYINQHGGINGKKLVFLDCNTDGTSAASVACANRFVAGHVPVVLEGLDAGADAAVPILAGAGIPLVGHTAFGPVQANSPDAFFFGAATGAYDVVPLVVMKTYLHLDSVVYLAQDNPTDRAFVQEDMQPAAKKLSMSLSSVFYNAQSPNFTSTVASAIASHPQAIFFTTPEPDCTSIIQAASTLGYKGYIFAGSCSAFIQALGSAANGIFTSSDLYVPDATTGVPAAKLGQVKAYVSYMDKYDPKYADGFAQDTFSSTMDIANILKGIHGKVTASAVLQALKHVDGLSSFMGQTLDCNGKQWPGETSACASGLIEYRVENGSRIPYTHGFVHAQQYV